MLAGPFGLYCTLQIFALIWILKVNFQILIYLIFQKKVINTAENISNLLKIPLSNFSGLENIQDRNMSLL